MEISGRTRINLSQTAKSILRRDRYIFNATKEFNEGSFINIILQRYLENDFPINPTYSSIKGKSQVYYIKDKIVNRLQSEVRENKIIKQFLTFSEFLKVLIESYCRFPCIEREKIILRDIILAINDAIHSSKIITMTTFKGINSVLPYRIVPSNEALFSYLIAFEENENKFKAYRISLIRSIRTLNKTFKFNKNINFSEINDLLVEYGPTFAFEPIETIMIQFMNEQAEQSYLYSAIHRPIHTRIVDEKLRVYEFKCSLKQATYFFFRFAGDIKILSPSSLKDEFKEMYNVGLEATMFF